MMTDVVLQESWLGKVKYKQTCFCGKVMEYFCDLCWDGMGVSDARAIRSSILDESFA